MTVSEAEERQHACEPPEVREWARQLAEVCLGPPLRSSPAPQMLPKVLEGRWSALLPCEAKEVSTGATMAMALSLRTAHESDATEPRRSALRGG